MHPLLAVIVLKSNNGDAYTRYYQYLFLFYSTSHYVCHHPWAAPEKSAIYILCGGRRRHAGGVSYCWRKQRRNVARKKLRRYDAKGTLVSTRGGIICRGISRSQRNSLGINQQRGMAYCAQMSDKSSTCQYIFDNAA